MRLVGMDYHDIIGEAVESRAAKVEGLHATQGVTDRIGIVPVQVIGMTGEKGLEAGKTRLGRSMTNPIGA